MQLSAPTVHKVTLEGRLDPACPACGRANPEGLSRCTSCGGASAPPEFFSADVDQADENALANFWHHFTRSRRSRSAR